MASQLETGASLVRQARALALVEAVEQVGLTPISVTDFHAFSYFGNVLSPVWNIPPQKRSVLKKRGGPYYPELQSDVDRLVGLGLVGVENLGHHRDEADRWKLEGMFFISDYEKCQKLLDSFFYFSDERRLFEFYVELARAFATLPKHDRLTSVEEDAVYGVNVGDEVIIDFAEWQQQNYSEFAARDFDTFMPVGMTSSSAQKLHFYTYHLRERLASNG